MLRECFPDSSASCRGVWPLREFPVHLVIFSSSVARFQPNSKPLGSINAKCQLMVAHIMLTFEGGGSGYSKCTELQPRLVGHPYHASCSAFSWQIPLCSEHGSSEQKPPQQSVSAKTKICFMTSTHLLVYAISTWEFDFMYLWAQALVYISGRSLILMFC